MSLFDVIRYPVNKDFTVEDLERIPFPLLIEWWTELIEYSSIHHGIFYMSRMKRCMERHIDSAFWMSQCMKTTDLPKFKKYALEALQRRLNEHDE